MTEPTLTVHPDQVVFMLGQKEVEIQLLRTQLAAAQKKIEELTPKEPVLEVVK